MPSESQMRYKEKWLKKCFALISQLRTPGVFHWRSLKSALFPCATIRCERKVMLALGGSVRTAPIPWNAVAGARRRNGWAALNFGEPTEDETNDRHYHRSKSKGRSRKNYHSNQSLGSHR